MIKLVLAIGLLFSEISAYIQEIRRDRSVAGLPEFSDLADHPASVRHVINDYDIPLFAAGALQQQVRDVRDFFADQMDRLHGSQTLDFRDKTTLGHGLFDGRAFNY